MLRYPSDLTDDQWKVLEPQARAVMSEPVLASGRPVAHDLRAMVDAVAYVVRNGIEWRALPCDFPQWDSAYAFYQRWSERSLPRELASRLRGRLREHQGRKPQPTACIADSQIVKSAGTVPAATRGYHGGKKVTGRGRRLARDYERTTAHSEAMIWWATVFIMTKRLTRYETGQPQPARWGSERHPPSSASSSINRL